MSVSETTAPENESNFERGTPNTVLHIDDVHKSFAGLHALSDVDLDVREGETHAIIGPNGAGKSTLMRTIVTLQDADSGHILLDDLNMHLYAFSINRLTGFE